MKKIFTLIAVAAMALSVNAQEKLVFSAGETYADNQILSTENVKLTLGNDQNPGTYKIGQTPLDAEKNAYLESFFQTVSTDDGDKNGVVVINGGNNPKDKVGKNSGSGFNAGYERCACGRMGRAAGRDDGSVRQRADYGKLGGPERVQRYEAARIQRPV